MGKRAGQETKGQERRRTGLSACIGIALGPVPRRCFTQERVAVPVAPSYEKARKSNASQQTQSADEYQQHTEGHQNVHPCFTFAMPLGILK